MRRGPALADLTVPGAAKPAAGKGAGRRLRSLVTEAIRRRLSDDPPSLRLIFWDGEAAEFAADPRVTIRITDSRILRALLAGNFSALGDAYVAGGLLVEGRAEDIVAVGVQLADRLGRTRWAQRAAALARLVPRRHSRRRDNAHVRYHYDVSNAFYGLWLDRRMVYSCAYFTTGNETIDAAQEAKLEHICRKLDLGPGERLLDVGCGWGGLLILAAERFGIEGVGITLSPAQAELARERAAQAGLAGRIEIRLADYRDMTDAAAFDKIASVGMVEHVGLANLPLYFKTLFRLLRPGGTLLNHGITVTDPGGRARGPAGGDFIDRYVFPGGELAHVSRIIALAAEAGFEIAAVEDLRPHYALTLQHWSRRLEAASAAAAEAAGADKLRIWKVYLAGMALAFDRGWLTIDQVLARKPLTDGPAPRPWTLDHVYGAGPSRITAGLDWTKPRKRGGQ